MTEQRTSYRQIFKATSLFGGVQVFNILISIVKSKFIALLLGPSGLGVFGLLTSSLNFVTGLTNFGLGTSAVRNVTISSKTNDEVRISTVKSVLLRLVWLTGILGTILVVIFAPLLSELTFGNKDYSTAFTLISITLLFQQLSSGQLALLQGFRKLQYLAKANLYGAILGLVISIPLYYVWRLDGIIPAIVISSFISMLFSWYFARKIKIQNRKVHIREIISEGRDMIKMGILLSLSGLITLASSYLVRIYISNTGGINQVGLYNAGFAIINTYVGMIFTSMSTDYYPRLSAVANNNKEAKELINQQAGIAILILAPILAIFLVFVNWIIVLLYSQKFLPINEMIHWAALAMYFKATTWSIGFILMAKGASNIFFWSELIGNIYTLLFNILGYKIGGLEGLGISFLIGYLIYFIQIFLIAKLKYSFSFRKDFYVLAGFQFFIGILCFVVMRVKSSPSAYILGSILVIISVVYSLLELEKRIGFKELILSKYYNLKN